MIPRVGHVVSPRAAEWTLLMSAGRLIRRMKLSSDWLEVSTETCDTSLTEDVSASTRSQLTEVISAGWQSWSEVRRAQEAAAVKIRLQSDGCSLNTTARTPHSHVTDSLKLHLHTLSTGGVRGGGVTEGWSQRGWSLFCFVKSLCLSVDSGTDVWRCSWLAQSVFADVLLRLSVSRGRRDRPQTWTPPRPSRWPRWPSRTCSATWRRRTWLLSKLTWTASRRWTDAATYGL